MLTRNTSRFGESIHIYSSLGQFYSERTPSGLITIDYGGGHLDILHKDRGADATLVIFHAALSRIVTSYPVFSGLGITSDLDCNLICLSDPSLELDLELAWFAGSKSQPLQRDLPVIIRHILDTNNYVGRLVFFGASGGGFASLFYSQLFPNSISITANPQTSIGEYSVEFVEDYRNKAWNGLELSAVPIAHDLREVYREGFSNSVVFLQNIRDGHHRDRHLAHWLRAIPTSDRMFLLMDDWGVGHIPPDKDLLHNTLKLICRSGTNELKSLGFVQSPKQNTPAMILKDFLAKQD